jgi:hypothetical protein
MKKIECLEKPYFLDGSIKRYDGDIFTSELGQYYIDLGWAKCVETGICGNRVVGVSKIKPKSVITTLGD